MNGKGTIIIITIGVIALDFFFVGAFIPQTNLHHQPVRFFVGVQEQDDGVSSPSSTTKLSAKLWERLEIEEDEEPMWYLLNCVAGRELDLLRQCEVVCADMPVKFVVPTETKTRSHGANRMVTETKVKYLGYVFAKLRLCEEVYEAIQGLDLCRSWMGTVNHKGYKKLPPSPLALNELEIEKFGLEDMEEDAGRVDDEVDDESGVIVDDDEDEKDSNAVDEKALEVYLGLKVEDMVKVTASGKFHNEDGIVRRLKDGKIFLRFYTYGSMFEEWLDPGDVRKLSNIEVLKGLSGPSQPITQRDFDGPRERSDRGGRDSDLRKSFLGGGAGGGRNRRQDRNANRYSQDRDFFGRSAEERRREERNWNWYQDQQRQKRGNTVASDGMSSNVQSGSRRDDDTWALGDVESQWGRKPQRQRRREEQRQKNKYDNRRAEAAIEGTDDWSSFVSSPDIADTTKSSIGGGAADDSDDFFDSLMSDLSKDLGSESSTSASTESNDSRDTEEDEFFSSLMADLTGTTANKDKPSNERRSRASSSPSQERISPGGDTDDADDFFASLEAGLGDTFEDVGSSPDGDDDTDDFFAKLEAELSPSAIGSGYEADVQISKENEGGESSTESKVSAPQPSRPSTEAAPPSNLEKCTVPILKDMLRERGLKVSGKKSELIERLTTSS